MIDGVHDYMVQTMEDIIFFNLKRLHTINWILTGPKLSWKDMSWITAVHT